MPWRLDYPFGVTPEFREFQMIFISIQILYEPYRMIILIM
eukprot:UN26008